MPCVVPSSLVRFRATLTESQLQRLAWRLASLVGPGDQRSDLHTCALASASASEPDWADDGNFRAEPATAPVQDEAYDYRSSAPGHPPRPNMRPPRNHREGPPPPGGRDLVDYFMLANEVATARRTYLLRDIMEEMALNGIAPDRQFLESAIRFSLQSSRVGDCFYYFEEMQRRGMQPSDRIKSSLVSVLARTGDMSAALEVLKEVQPSAHENGYQLSLAIVNAFGEKGNVAAVREHLQSFLRLYGNAPNAVTYGYMALIKAYRKKPFGDRAEFAREVLAALAEAQAAIAASPVPQKAWALPPAALFALQKYGCHEAVVELFESIPQADKEIPTSWAYTHTIISYIKDATGIFRWPTSEVELRRALKSEWTKFLKEKHEARRAREAAEAASAASAAAPEQATVTVPDQEAASKPQQELSSEPDQETSSEPELATVIVPDEALASAPEQAMTGEPDQATNWDTRGNASGEDSSSEDDDDEGGFDDVSSNISSDDSSDDESDDVSEPTRDDVLFQHQWSSNTPLLGPAGEALKLARMREVKWVPREAYSKLRYQYLKGLANRDSWERAIALHAEMNQKGLELPASELLEFIEASIQMEAMGCRGALQVGVDLLDRFGQVGFKRKFINALVGSHLLRFAVQRHVGNLSLAHKLWDLLIAQGDVPERPSCRAYLLAMEQREPDSPQLPKVTEIVLKEYGVVNRPKRFGAKLRAERKQAEAAAAEGG
ncbi:hypothetical protein WJX75_006740 [Coccomyxa subellipsoidea]|uniref:Pentacotripeptide-repeat region of PRORP domain-containing protein n=1 Tax=Coccomyxa subellipsoidea TaxID=248742 RepID=A0ABR2YRT1_9CHLO